MGIGELEFSNLPFGLDGLKYTILLAFILVILLSVINLINGLAVYDVKEIRDEAEHLANKSQVETLHSLVSSSVSNLYNVICHVKGSNRVNYHNQFLSHHRKWRFCH